MLQEEGPRCRKVLLPRAKHLKLHNSFFWVYYGKRENLDIKAVYLADDCFHKPVDNPIYNWLPAA